MPQKMEYEGIPFKSFDTDALKMKHGNFMKECVTLSWTFNQELRYVGARLGT
jgi:hypothetical protein